MASRLTSKQYKSYEREALNDREQTEWMPSSDCKQLEDFLEMVTYELNFKGREFQADGIAHQKAQSCEEIAHLRPCKYSSKGLNWLVAEDGNEGFNRAK